MRSANHKALSSVGRAAYQRFLLAAEIAKPVFGLLHDFFETQALMLLNISTQIIFTIVIVIDDELLFNTCDLLRPQRQCQIGQIGQGFIDCQ